MGSVRAFAPEKLVVAVLLSEPQLKESLLAELERRFGDPDWVSSELPFDYTHYYDEEMGTPISRFFVSFRRLVEPQRLAEIKTATNLLEDSFRREGRRPVNLDPGLLSLGRFVLASTKPCAHRIPLSGGIHAEITLLYEKGSFRAVEWTYPDYASGEYRAILNRIRALYKEQL